MGKKMTTPSESFGEKVKLLREQKGLSQYALAQRTGLSKQLMSLIEKGASAPSWTTVQLLAAALDVDCTAFADAGLTLPDLEPARPRGRPKKSPPTTEPADVQTPAPAAKAKPARKRQ
jgi:transcriptional regulator with XRE-family HTH domain